MFYSKIQYSKLHYIVIFILSLTLNTPIFASANQMFTGFESVVTLSLIFLTIYLVISFVGLRYIDTSTHCTSHHFHPWLLTTLLIGTFLIRLILAVNYKGHPTDMACWGGWALGMANYGPSSFYESVVFADYPPGYMLILWPIGILLKSIELLPTSILYNIILKLPIFFFDLLAGGLIYWYACKKQFKFPLLLTGLFLFNPAIIFDSAVWGQVDIILSFFVILMIIAFYEKKLLWASLAFVGGLLIKPQMFLFGPVFIIGYFYYCNGRTIKAIIRSTLISCGMALLFFLVVCFPFLLTKSDPFWIVQLYFSTMGSYPYASVNAINLMSLINGLWISDAQTFWGISYKLLGAIGIFLSLVYTFYLAYKDKSKANFALYGALMILGIFTLGHHMHERYIFPALICLFIAYLYVPKKTTFFFLVYFSILQTLNMSLVLRATYLYSNMPFVFVLSLLQVLGYIAFCIYAYQISLDGFKPISNTH